MQIIDDLRTKRKFRELKAEAQDHEAWKKKFGKENV